MEHNNMVGKHTPFSENDIALWKSLNMKKNMIETRTCVPYVLHPNIRASGEKYPLNWYEKEADHVWSESYTDKEHGKSLQREFGLKQ